MDIDTSHAAMSVGRHLLFHAPKNCTSPAIEEFPTGLFTLEQRLHGAIIVHIITTIYVIATLGVIAHEYFVPAMEKLLDITKIDPDIAGTAVMATAASTPQLATAVVGVFVAKSDIGVGAIVGSSYFNIFFIVGVCALVAKEPLRLAWWPIFRDIFFYILSASILAILLDDQKATWWNGLILMVVYGLYILVLVFNARLEHAATKIVRIMRLGFKRCHCKQCRDRGNKEDCEDCGLVDSLDSKKNIDVKEKDPNLNISAAEKTEAQKGASYQSFDTDSQPKEEGNELHSFPKYDELSDKEECSCCDDPAMFFTCIKGEDSSSSTEEEYHSILRRPKTVLKQIIWVLMLPALFIVFILIPDCRRPKSWRYLFIFTILMSVVVISINAYILVWMVSVIGSTIGIPDTVMGLTFLAAGASVPDMLNAVLVARRGYGDMAVSNCIGSNIFDVLVCLGLPWFLDILFARRSYPLLIQDDVSTIAVCLVASAFILFCCLFIANWRINKMLGGLLIAAYLGFITFTSIFSNKNALPTCPSTV